MERKINKLEHSHVEVICTVDEKSWKAAQKKAFDKLAKDVTVQGFRKGKAPENLVKNKVDQVKVMDEAINSLLPQLYKDIIEIDGVKPYAQPKVDVTKLSETEVEIKFDIVVAPEVKLGAYKGLEVGHDKVSVTAKDVDSAIDALVKNNGSLVVKEGESVLGDTVVIDFVGTVDGVAFEGGSAQNHELELGSHSFIPGFEEQLVGHKAGEHVDVNVTFPENYTPELKGKAAVFGCDIHEVKEKKLPELNDEFVKELKLEGVETLDQLKESKKAELKANKEAEERKSFIGKVMDKVLAGSEIDLPEEIVENQVNARKQDMEKRMSQSGLTLEQYLQIVGQKEEDFLAKLKEDALKDIKGYLVFEKIAEVENLVVSDEELEFEFAKLAEQYKMKVEDVKKALAAQQEEFRNNIKMSRVEDLLVKNNK